MYPAGLRRHLALRASPRRGQPAPVGRPRELTPRGEVAQPAFRTAQGRHEIDRPGGMRPGRPRPHERDLLPVGRPGGELVGRGVVVRRRASASPTIFSQMSELSPPRRSRRTRSGCPSGEKLPEKACRCRRDLDEARRGELGSSQAATASGPRPRPGSDGRPPTHATVGVGVGVQLAAARAPRPASRTLLLQLLQLDLHVRPCAGSAGRAPCAGSAGRSAPAPSAPRARARSAAWAAPSAARRASPRRAAGERPPARDHLVEHRAEGEDVAARVDRPSAAPAPATCRRACPRPSPGG